MKKIKILITSTSGFARKEGISTVIIDYFSRFNLEQFEPHIVIAGEFDKKLVEEIKTAGIVPEFLHSRKKELMLYIRDLFRLLKCGKYDVLYANGSSAIMSIELFAAMLCGCKLRVVHSHNTTCDHKMADSILRPIFYLLYTDAFACGNEAGRWLFGKRKFTIVHNGRDISKYSFDESKRKNVRQRLGIDDDCFVVGHVGNFNRQKNQKFALEVIKELIKINENSLLYLMGTGAMLDDVKNMASEMGIADKVIFTGAISNVEEMLQAMDVMLLPSLYEGLPLVVVEWQMAGLPSLISDKVSNECEFSKLVHFMALEKTPAEWAGKLIEIANYDRGKESIGIHDLAKNNGYIIDNCVEELQSYILGRVHELKRV